MSNVVRTSDRLLRADRVARNIGDDLDDRVGRGLRTALAVKGSVLTPCKCLTMLREPPRLSEASHRCKRRWELQRRF